MDFKKLLPLVVTLAAVHANAAVTMVNGGENHPSLLQSQTDWTIDLGVALPVFPSSPGVVLFESGGDGTGVAAVIIASDLVVYQDNGDFNASSPDPDNFGTWDISAFSGQVVSMRAVGSLGTADDSIALTILGVGSTFNETLALKADIENSAGGNRFGFGGVAQDLAGLDESAEAGFPNMGLFQNAEYDVDMAPFGGSALGADRIKGVVYTDGDAAPTAIPSPDSWGLDAVPEPGTGILSLLGAGFLFIRRKR